MKRSQQAIDIMYLAISHAAAAAAAAANPHTTH